jgi:hypothetical protein
MFRLFCITILPVAIDTLLIDVTSKRPGQLKSGCDLYIFYFKQTPMRD